MSKQTAYPDLLPWGHLAGSGMVFTKDSQILAGYYFRPPDADSRTGEDADALSDHVNAALTIFGTGWSSWGDVVSFPSGHYPDPSQSHFPDPFSRAVDDARRRHFEAAGRHYENERVLLVCYAPPAAHVSKMSDLFFTSDGRKRQPTQQRIVAYFNETLDKFENRIAGALGMRRMRSFSVTDAVGDPGRQDELVNYLNYCATGRVQGVMLPKAGAYLDLLIASQEVSPGENPIIGRDYVGVVAIDGIPGESQPNILAALNILAMPYRFSQRTIYLDTVHAVKEIGRYRDRWRQKVRGLGQLIMQNPDAPVNEHAVERTREATAALAAAESGTVKFGFYTPTVIVRHPDPAVLKEWTDQIEQVISGCGYGARTETTNTIEAWRGALPGDTYSNVRQPPIHTKTASDLLPLSGVWTGEEYAPCPLYPPNSPALLYADTAGAIPFRLNLHIGPRSDLGHTFTFGPSSTGKTVLTNTIALQARRYRGMRITAFDYKGGMMATALACGGRHYDLANDIHVEGLCCPLGVMETETDIEWAADYLAVLYELQERHPPDSVLRTDIIDGVRAIAAAPRHMRTMTHFVFSALQNVEARRVFEFYTMKGAAGRFLDGVSDPRDDGDFLVYETQDLMGLGEQTALAVLLYQFRRFERSLKGNPALLFLAECHQVFGHTIWRERLVKWLRLLRSKNCAVIMDTQSLADAAATSIFSLLVENVQRKIFLPNPAAMQSTDDLRTPGPKELYRMFGLNDRQIALIRDAVPKRDYYVTGPDGCRKVSLGLSTLELAIAGATSETDVLAVREAYQHHGDRWLTEYLGGLGIDYQTIPGREAAYA